MSRIKTLKGHCTHCNGLLEFPAEATGTTTTCPLCGQQTELMLARPIEEPTIPRRTIVWTLIAVLVLGGGLAGTLVGLKWAERGLARKSKKAAAASSLAQATNAAPPVDVTATNEFRASPITLDKVQGSSLVYAKGTLTNLSPRQRFGVRIELDLLETNGQKIGTASDYQPVIEPNGQWQFKALVVDPKATASARLASIKEQQ